MVHQQRAEDEKNIETTKKKDPEYQISRNSSKIHREQYRYFKDVCCFFLNDKWVFLLFHLPERKMKNIYIYRNQ